MTTEQSEKLHRRVNALDFSLQLLRRREAPTPTLEEGRAVGRGSFVDAADFELIFFICIFAKKNINLIIWEK